MKRWLWGMLLSAWISGGFCAEPYMPAGDGEVLEHVAKSVPERQQLRSLRQQVAEKPADPASALALARFYIELGRTESDPRYYGRAESVLLPWLSGDNPLPEALTMRAILYQNRHEFGKALADLSAALARQPRLAQAWLTRAVILQVQGDYPAAMKSCLPLIKLSSDLLAAACINSGLSLSGQAEFAYQRLNQALAGAQGEVSERLWAWVTLAEMAEQLGKFSEAERHYREALTLKPKTGYLLASYADFLLDRGRPAEVIDLLRDEARADNLLLRLALAEQRLNSPALAEHIEILKARFSASRLRGDASHQGDEARFTLHLLKEPARALELALTNWTVQREPRDLRILLEAARAAENVDAAQPGLDFLSRTHLQDVRLEGLAEYLRTHS